VGTQARSDIAAHGETGQFAQVTRQGETNRPSKSNPFVAARFVPYTG